MPSFSATAASWREHCVFTVCLGYFLFDMSWCLLHGTEGEFLSFCIDLLKNTNNLISCDSQLTSITRKASRKMRACVLIKRSVSYLYENILCKLMFRSHKMPNTTNCGPLKHIIAVSFLIILI